MFELSRGRPYRDSQWRRIDQQAPEAPSRDAIETLPSPRTAQENGIARGNDAMAVPRCVERLHRRRQQHIVRRETND